MIVEIVTFKSPPGWDRSAVLEDAKHTIPKWTANRDLVRKHFLVGLGDAADIGCGVYVWPSIQAAEAAHDAAWREGVKKRTGGYPEIRCFDLMLLIDNAAGTVTEYDAAGKARALERAPAE